MFSSTHEAIWFSRVQEERERRKKRYGLAGMVALDNPGHPESPFPSPCLLVSTYVGSSETPITVCFSSAFPTSQEIPPLSLLAGVHDSSNSPSIRGPPRTCSPPWVHEPSRRFFWSEAFKVAQVQLLHQYLPGPCLLEWTILNAALCPCPPATNYSP